MRIKNKTISIPVPINSAFKMNLAYKISPDIHTDTLKITNQ
jgi:hypothetical protein